MALSIINTERKFKVEIEEEEIELDDPNPNLSVQEVLKFYSGRYPEITNATAEGPKMENDKAVYTLTPNLGKKG